MNNVIDTNNNNSNDINIPAEESVDNTIDNNFTFRANNTIWNRSCKDKWLNTCKDKLISKQSKVSDGHMLAEFIVAVMEKIWASWKKRQKAVKVRRELEILVALEFSKI